MTKYTLENLEVKNPCPIEWDTMTGGDEIRRCDTCRHEVYDISAMPKRRALKILNQPEKRICVSYYRDDQNRIVTQNYFSVFKRNLIKVGGAMLAIIFSFTSLYAFQTKPATPKKKKTVKHRKYKKQTKPPQKRVVGPSGKSRPIIGILQ